MMSLEKKNVIGSQNKEQGVPGEDMAVLLWVMDLINLPWALILDGSCLSNHLFFFFCKKKIKIKRLYKIDINQPVDLAQWLKFMFVDGTQWWGFL